MYGISINILQAMEKTCFEENLQKSKLFRETFNNSWKEKFFDES